MKWSMRKGVLAAAGAAGLLLAGVAMASNIAGMFRLQGERLMLSPQQTELPAGARVTIELVRDCAAPCEADAIDSLLAEAGETIEWQVDGVPGGADAVGRVEPARTDEAGRVVAVTYIAPDEVPAPSLNPVTVTAVVADAFSRTQYQFTAEVRIVQASGWSGWVNVQFTGMYDDAPGSGAAGTYEEYLRNYRSERGADANFFPSGSPREVAWLSFDNRFLITDAFTEASDDSGWFAMLTGGASGRMTYRSRFDEPCGGVIWTERDGEAMNMDPRTRLIRFDGHIMSAQSTLQTVPPLLYNVEGRRHGRLCAEHGFEDIPAETSSESNEPFGLVDRLVEDADAVNDGDCFWQHSVTYADTVYYAGKDFRGNMTVSWCIDHRRGT